MAESLPKSVSSLKIPTDGNFTPFLAWNSLRKSNMAMEKCSSCGLVRKNHFRPRRCNDGDDDSPDMYGIPYRSHTWLAVADTELW